MKIRSSGLLSLLITIPLVRVAVIKDIPSITLQGKELRFQLEEPKPVSYHVESPVQVFPRPEGFLVGEEVIASPVLKFMSVESPMTVEGKIFPGKIELRRTGGNKLLVLSEVPLEEYLAGLFPGEMPADWPPEAVKAQVVAARTYALFRQKQNPNPLYDLETDTADQVYQGRQGEKEIPESIRQAIAATQGEVVWYLGYYPAYFHSSCGGQTELARRVWERNDISHSVADRYCKNSPYREWELALPQKEFLKILREQGLEGSRVLSVKIEKKEGSPRNFLVIAETDQATLFLKATRLRKLLGNEKLKSTWFEVLTTPGHVIFHGTGFGHGVGLCQWGAKAMAEKGADYKAILQFYYPKAVVRKIY